MICGERRDEEFNLDKDKRVCDRCYDLMDYWTKEMVADLKQTSKAHMGEEANTSDILEEIAWFVEGCDIK